MQMSRISVLCVFFMLFLVNTLHGKNVVLSAGQVSKLLNDATVTVSDADPSVKANKRETFRVYFGPQGLVEVMRAKGGEESRAWSINDDGRLCVSRSFVRRKGGATCGYLVSDGSGAYTMYKVKGSVTKGKRVPSGRNTKPLLIFSEFAQGRKL